LRKISEIYDRIGFAGVGKYNEFDHLRQAGVRSADIKGYQYSRSDVDARSLASIYARTMGSVFTHEAKPLEVEILVAEVGTTPELDRLFHILYDGTVMDESRFSVLGGDAESVAERMSQLFTDHADVKGAIRAAAQALGGSERTLRADELEVAVLERNAHRRCFRRLDDATVEEHLSR
jgi:proteasome alpha subunit